MTKRANIQSGESLSVEDLRGYLVGNLSPSERQSIEAQLSDDPLAADALEGLKHLPSYEMLEQATKPLTQESKRLINRKKQRHFIGMSVRQYMAAASVIFVLWAGYFVVQKTIKENKTTPTIAQNTSLPKPSTLTPHVLSPDDYGPEQFAQQQEPKPSPLIYVYPGFVPKQTDQKALIPEKKEAPKVNAEAMADDVAPFVEQEKQSAPNASVTAAPPSKPTPKADVLTKTTIESKAPAIIYEAETKNGAGVKQILATPIAIAKQFMEEGKYKKAIDQLKPVVDNPVDPDRQEAQWLLVEAYLGKKDKVAAKKLLEEIIKAGGTYKDLAKWKLEEIQ